MIQFFCQVANKLPSSLLPAETFIKSTLYHRCFPVNLRNFSELHLHDIDKACSIVWKCFRLSFGVGNADGISSFPTQSTKNIKPIRSSCSQVYFKKDVLKNFAIFTGKRLCWSVFSIKLQVRKFATLLKRDSTQVFSWEI